ncbi:MAG: hypothetical protein FWD88_02720, partial [Treponema sp.]|nr:hypothetical protein [Treponema sp.]
DTTAIDFTFGVPVSGLTADDITVEDGTGAAIVWALTGSGTEWSLEVAVTSPGDITVTIAMPGIEERTATVTVHPVTWTAVPDSTTATTAIDFTFAIPVSGLTANDITIEDGTGTVTRGALTGNCTSWSLEVTVTNPGTVQVTVARPGIESRTATVEVHPVTWTVTATSSANAAVIGFTFGAPVTELTAADITVTSGTGTVIPGALTGSGTSRSLTVTVTNPGSIQVTVTRPGIESRTATVQVIVFAIREVAVGSSGSRHTVAIGRDGTLWAWGNNSDGQLGDGTTTDRHSPVQIGEATNWASVSAGLRYTVAIRGDGSLWAWGSNFNGQLGDGTTINRHSPVRIGAATNWASVSAGDNHTMAIRTDGSLWAWGSNFDGQLGDGTSGTVNSRHAPIRIGMDANWESVSAGNSHTMAIRRDGTLWGWGWNGGGRLGDGTTTARHSPTRIGTATNWASVSAGPNFTMAVRTDGTLWGWGDNIVGQLGDGTSGIVNRHAPVRIGTTTNWASVTTGFASPSRDGIIFNWYSVAVRTDGSLWAWGDNRLGQLGTGNVTSQHTPVRVGFGTNWVSVSIGGHSAAIQADGSLWAWGLNDTGWLGDGTTTDRRSPTRIGWQYTELP